MVHAGYQRGAEKDSRHPFSERVPNAFIRQPANTKAKLGQDLETLGLGYRHMSVLHFSLLFGAPTVNQHPPAHHPLDVPYSSVVDEPQPRVNIWFHLGNQFCRK